ncbi:hypothetical protein BKI52_09245 [marine bacterium AO1-C]|nr:hypothetical protein BKI52_09245 [marine bacterium AO1-C]
MKTNALILKVYLIVLSFLLTTCNTSNKKNAEKKSGKNPDLLQVLTQKIAQGKYPKTNALLISKKGKVVFEKYFNDYHEDSLQDVRSTTKSITALLTGIAIDKGFIKSVHSPMLDYLHQYNKNTLQNWDQTKDSITIEHLLTMQTGIGCEQFFGNMGLPDCEEKMFDQNDWVKYGLDQKMAFKPGTKWLYTGTAPMIMGAVVSEASNKSIDAFASDYLFKPIGISHHYKWTKNRKTGRVFTAGNLRITPRNLLKIGHLVINGGRHQGKRVISEQMINSITSQKVTLPNNYSFFKTAGNTWKGQKPAKYGYYWYTEEVKMHNKTLTLKFTFGNGGNYIVLVPELDNLVIIFTGSNYGKPILNKQPFDMMYQYIIPHFLKSNKGL